MGDHGQLGLGCGPHGACRHRGRRSRALQTHKNRLVALALRPSPWRSSWRQWRLGKRLRQALLPHPRLPEALCRPATRPRAAWAQRRPTYRPGPHSSDTPIPQATSSPASAAPIPAYLFDLTPINGSYQVGSKTVNGQTYSRSVFHGLSECNAGDGKGFLAEYDLGRKYKTFTATAGLSDLDTRGSRTIEFRIDTDRGHQDFTADRGEPHKVTFNVSGALFLRLTVYEANGSGPCIVDTVAVWGDAQLKQ